MGGDCGNHGCLCLYDVGGGHRANGPRLYHDIACSDRHYIDRSANLRLVAIAALFVMLTTPEAILGQFSIIICRRDRIDCVLSGHRAAMVYERPRLSPAWRPIYYLAGIMRPLLLPQSRRRRFHLFL